MRLRTSLFAVVAVVGLALGTRAARADEPTDDHPAADHAAAPAEDHAAPAAGDAEHHAGDAEHHADDAEHHADDAEHHAGDAEHHADDAEHHAGDAAADHDDGGDRDDDDGDVKVPFNQFDEDGDGKVSAEELADEKTYEEDFKGITATIDTDATDRELEARPADANLRPSLTVDQFRKMVQITAKIVLPRMEKKMAKKSAKRMSQFSTGIFVFSLLGLLLLGIPLVVGKKYPGQSGVLFKYSALASVTFFVTVNLFGGVLMGMRTVQGALSNYTNPTIAIASATFDTLDRNAEEYITMGKELFAPTLEQLRGNNEEQPSVLLLENGQKIIKDAKVFVSVAKMFKKVSFIFDILPIVLFGVTMILFGLAIRPTLTEIVKLPMRAAAGEAGVGRDTIKRAMARVIGELWATLATIGVLAGLTVVSAFVLGRVVAPALDALLDYFSRTVTYLQFVEGASSGLVFLTLFGVILFLVFNLAALILSMGFFLGKSQKIFQQRFNDGIPVSRHKRFFQWGIPAVLLIQLFPWLYAAITDQVLTAIDHSVMAGVNDAASVPWTRLLLAGPVFLVIGFVLAFWAARGIKAIKFLQSYKVKPTVAPAAAPSGTAEPV